MNYTPTQRKILKLLKQRPMSTFDLADGLYGYHGETELNCVWAHLTYARQRGMPIGRIRRKDNEDKLIITKDNCRAKWFYCLETPLTK